MTLEKEFTAFLLDLANRIKEETEDEYDPTLFRRMVANDGGLVAAQMLIHKGQVSDGYTKLWELGRLDLTLEAQILKNKKYYPLFTEEELETCKNRLKDYEYDGFSD